MQKVRKAVFTAAGLGTRMRPLTNRVPKPLVKVRGKALIDHVIDRLAGAGVELVVVNVHHHAALLKELQLEPLLDLQLRLGEGTGAVLALFLLDAAVAILNGMATFDEAGVSQREGEPSHNRLNN